MGLYRSLDQNELSRNHFECLDRIILYTILTTFTIRKCLKYTYIINFTYKYTGHRYAVQL